MRLAAAHRLMMGRFVATELSLSAGLAGIGWDVQHGQIVGRSVGINLICSHMSIPLKDLVAWSAGWMDGSLRLMAANLYIDGNTTLTGGLLRICCSCCGKGL